MSHRISAKEEIFMKKWWCLVAAAAIALPAAVQSGKPAPAKMEPPKPAAEVSQFDHFNGRWGCTGQVLANDMVPAHPTTAIATSAPELSGSWRLFRYVEQKTKENPMPFAATGMWGYDVAQKKYVEVSADNMGSYSILTSGGWSGDSIIFEGESQMMGRKTGSRDIFTKKGAGEFVHSGEFQGADGKWAKFDEETCKKASAKTMGRPGPEKSAAAPKK
jgi:hypothetical protein